MLHTLTWYDNRNDVRWSPFPIIWWRRTRPAAHGRARPITCGRSGLLRHPLKLGLAAFTALDSSKENNVGMAANLKNDEETIKKILKISRILRMPIFSGLRKVLSATLNSLNNPIFECSKCWIYGSSAIQSQPCTIPEN